MSKTATKSMVQTILDNRRVLGEKLNSMSIEEQLAYIASESKALQERLKTIEPIPWEEIEAKASKDFASTPTIDRLREIRDEMSKTQPKTQ